MSRIIATLSLLASIALSSPVAVGAGHTNHTLDLRDNPVSCGWNNMYPCSEGQTCYTSNNQAYCRTGQAQTAGGGDYQMFTTTFVVSQTYTVTSTYSSAIAVATGGTCNTAVGQHPCNPSLCCAADQWCDRGAQCRQNSVAGSPGLSPGLPPATVTVTTMTVGGVPTTISNFIAPTSVSIVTITSSGTATTTQALETPIGTSGATLPAVTAQAQTGGGGLSPGAIAGIVIGVLVGLFILFVILTCLCCKGIYDLIFGRKKKKETETFVQTHHSAHGSRPSSRPPPRRFFGILPGVLDRPDRPEKKSSGLGGLATVVGGLGTLAAILGIKRKFDERKQEQKSEYTASNVYYSDYYTDTSASKSKKRTSCEAQLTKYRQCFL